VEFAGAADYPLAKEHFMSWPSPEARVMAAIVRRTGTLDTVRVEVAHEESMLDAEENISSL